MRDTLIVLIIFCTVPLIPMLPFFGVIMWSWISYMNPHRLAWSSWVYDMPVGLIIGSVLVVGYILSREPKKIPVTRTTIVWLGFVLWFSFTTLFALNPDAAQWEWERTIKIQLIASITLAMLTSRQRIELLMWVIVVSIGFYGVKGGLFTLMTGGSYHVLGPKDSFIANNNEIAFALLVVLPLLRYLQLTASINSIRVALGLVLALSFIAAIGSQSRTALLMAAVLIGFLWWQSRRRIVLGVGLLFLVIFILSFMPESWFDRMETIQTYEEDASAMGRINAWGFAWNLAMDHPLTGGGFQTFTPELFLQYAPDPLDYHDSHSIYFETLAEHGIIGFGLFMLLAWYCWRDCRWLARHTCDRDDLVWARDMGLMLQVSLVTYAVGGLTIGLAYFDLLYHLVAMIVATKALVVRKLQSGGSVEHGSMLGALRPPPRANLQLRGASPPPPTDKHI